MMLAARLNNEHQGKLWAEAVATATKIHNAVPNHGNGGTSPDMLWYGEHPKILNHLVQWGSIGYVTNRGARKKLDPKSTKMVFMGYAEGHAGDVFKMYNPATGRIIATRDVIWAEWHGSQNIPESLKMFAEDLEVNKDDDQIGEDEVTKAPHLIVDDDEPPTGTKKREFVTPASGPHLILDDENSDSETGNRGVTRPDESEIGSEDSSQETRPRSNRVTRLSRELTRLNTYYNPTTHIMRENAGSDPETASKVFNVQLSSDPGEPNGFREAMNAPDRLKWISAMKNEIDNFLHRKVWTPMKLEKLRQGQKPIQVKWVMKRKHEPDGSTRYKGRIVVKGFVQVPGVDFHHTHSPVAQDSSIKTTLAIALAMDNWVVEMIDIEAAFLEADLDEDIYIEWPEGLAEFGYFTKAEMKGKCLKLEKAMYGCVQSPLMFFKTYGKHLEAIGLTQSLSDPCIWYKRSRDGNLNLIVAVYVDDCIIAGLKHEIETFKKDVQRRFKITDLGPIKKHLGVWYQRCKDKNGEYYKLTMENYQQEIVNDYERVTGKKVKSAATPGFPGQSLSKNEGDEVDKENYRKILGKLMWFTRKLMPECGNAIRELAMYMDNPGDEHWKAMGRMISYIGKEKVVELHLMKPRDLKIYSYVDSNFATNKETRKSVSGYIVTIGGCLVNWTSKTQPSVTLSSTEAEYVAASMCACEIKFMQMLMEELMPYAQLRPATLFEDNTGAMFLMENQAVGFRTKHIDIRWHHIREMMKGDDPRLSVQFVPSEENFADLETKNVTEGIHSHLANRLKDGRIQSAIFAANGREDVKKHNISYMTHWTQSTETMNVSVPCKDQASHKTNHMNQVNQESQDYKNPMKMVINKDEKDKSQSGGTLSKKVLGGNGKSKSDILKLMESGVDTNVSYVDIGDAFVQFHADKYQKKKEDEDGS